MKQLIFILVIVPIVLVSSCVNLTPEELNQTVSSGLNNTTPPQTPPGQEPTAESLITTYLAKARQYMGSTFISDDAAKFKSGTIFSGSSFVSAIGGSGIILIACSPELLDSCNATMEKFEVKKDFKSKISACCMTMPNSTIVCGVGVGEQKLDCTAQPQRWEAESISEGSAFKVVDKQLSLQQFRLVLGDKTGSQTTISVVTLAGDIEGTLTLAAGSEVVIPAGGQMAGTAPLIVTLTKPVAPGAAAGSFYKFTVTTTYTATGGLAGQKDVAQFNIKAV